MGTYEITLYFNIIMLITFIIIQNIKFKLFNYKKLNLEILGIILIIITYIVIAILTYYQPHSNLFFDPLNEIYGINKKNN